MNRRLAHLPLVLFAILAVVLSACAPTPPAAPALTDPKEIVAKGVTSLAQVKTFEFTGSFTGSVQVPQMGAFDLSTVKMAGAIDIPNKNLKFSLDAPTLIGTKVDAVVVGNTAYYKVSGALAMLAGGTADKYTKAEVPTASDDPIAAATDITKAVAEIQAALGKLPNAADEGRRREVRRHRLLPRDAEADRGRPEGARSDVDPDGRRDLRHLDAQERQPTGQAVLLRHEPGHGHVRDGPRPQYDVPVSVAAPPADQIAP